MVRFFRKKQLEGRRFSDCFFAYSFRSILGKLTLAFLLILVPVYALGIYIYNWSMETVKEDVAKSSQAYASFYLESLEKELERIKILQYDCINDENLQRLALMPDALSNYELVENIWRLHVRLQSIKNSSNYVKNVSVYLPLAGKTITSNRIFMELDRDRLEGVQTSEKSFGASLISYQEGLYLTAAQSLFLIEIELDKAAFQTDMEQFSIYENCGSILMKGRPDTGEILGAAAVSSQDMVQERTQMGDFLEESGVSYGKLGKEKYLLISAYSEYLGMYLIRYFRQGDVLIPLRGLGLWFWGFSLAVVVVIFVYTWFTYRVIHKPLQTLVASFRRLETGDFSKLEENGNNDEFGYLYSSYNMMAENLKNLIEQVYQAKIMMQQAQLKQLQSQINPHFLYNSLFLINTMALVGDENLVPFTQYLGEYFRFVTRNASDTVTLLEETEHARNYCKIQEMRFSRRLQLEFQDCPEEYARLKVPRLVLQPILENAFQYVVERKRQDCRIGLSFGLKDGFLKIRIEDNGEDLKEEQLEELKEHIFKCRETGEHTGLVNVHKRIRLYFGEESGLELDKSASGGLLVTLRFWLNRENGKL